MIYLMFGCALALSSAAAFYSIVGLMAIFAASPIPIAIMGSILEVSKLVIASWLYRNWDPVPKLMKGYFIFALVILMFLTSMGIFGFLSKAHLDQGVPSGDVAAKVALLEEKINIEKENINAARTTLNQLDRQVNETLGRTTDESGATRSATLRRSQAKERVKLTDDIATSQAKIAKLNEEKAPIAAELRKVEAEVGPIKYIAALIYEETDQTILEKAVRWVTILIVSVFDPLAVIMLIAANWTLMHMSGKPEPVQNPVQKIIAPIRKHVKRSRGKWREREAAQTKPVEEVKEPWTVPPPPVDIQQESLEHPVFQPESEVWGSRPTGHLKPHDPRRG